jgi:hypothetical protein
MNISEITVSSVPFTITPQFLADITLASISEQERLLPFGIRGFRECDVQFLLWRELVLRGCEAEMEEKLIDIAIFDNKQMIAAIELKGPWLARKFRYPNSFAGLAQTDFRKLSLISEGLSGQCYCLWTFAGPDEKTIEDAFDKFLECARTAAPDCLAESARTTSLLNLDKHGNIRWRKCRVYAVRVYHDSPAAVVT